MEKVYVVPITKNFEKQDLINAIVTFMQPDDPRFEKVETQNSGETYLVSLMSRQVKHTENWQEARSIQLTFDNEKCTVVVRSYVALVGSRNRDTRTLGMSSALATVGKPSGIMMGVTAGLMVGSDAIKAKKFEMNIMNIVRNYISDNSLNTQPSVINKTISQIKSKSTDYICACGNRLAKEEKFCSACGRARVDGMRMCSCGEKIKREMKFCPYCGAQSDEINEQVIND